ncbi:hypothetical protein MYX76_09490 [Desulfobacterota bacterium AH_259_B03_O07]|nr:hypothetical protein [Desulfobacterota bacterium AH_259_B03_O07]
MGIAQKTILLLLLLAAIVVAGEYGRRFAPKVKPILQEKISKFYGKTSESAKRYKEQTAAAIDTSIENAKKQVKTIKLFLARKPKPTRTKRTDKRIVPELQIAGGTYYDMRQGLVGTSFLIKRTTPFGTITFVNIHGPPGWNGSKPFVAKLYQQQGISKDFTVHWVFTPPITGKYKAYASAGGKKLEAVFYIDTRSRMRAPQIVGQKLKRARTIIEWLILLEPNERSFLVKIEAYPSNRILKYAVLPGNRRSVAFENVPFVTGTKYRSMVFAFSKDVRSPTEMTGPFNMSAYTIPYIFIRDEYATPW